MKKTLINRRKALAGFGSLAAVSALAQNVSKQNSGPKLIGEAPGRIALMKDGKLEIVVDRDGDFEDWLTRLEASIRSLMDLPESEPD